MNTIVGAVVGLPEVELIPLAASARRASPDARIVLLAQEPEKYTGLCNRYGISLRTAWLHRDLRQPIANEVYKHRWTELRDFLSREPANDRVIFADASDTVFQRDPFSVIGGWPLGLLVGSEGIKFEDEPWNRGILQANFPEHLPHLKSKYVLNAGNVAGFAGLLGRFAHEMHERLFGRDGLADMAAFNIVLRSLDWETWHTVADDPWLLHCAQRVPDSTIKKGPCDLPPPTFADTDAGRTVCDSFGSEFVMVHQWPYSRKALKFLGSIA
jgi:hypothetical protein